MNKRKKILAFFLAVLLIVGGIASMSWAAMLDMSGFNDDIITVSKVPKGKAGGKISIKMTIHNEFDEDLNNVEINLADEEDYKDLMEGLFGDEEDEDDSDEPNSSGIRRYDSTFPFEVDSTTFSRKKLGTIKSNKAKSVTVTAKLRRDLPEGYYQAFFYLNADERWTDKVVGVNIWVGAAGGTTEDDDETNIDYDFMLGENQNTPYAAYGQAVDFGVNLRNSGLKKVYDVRVDMQLDPDIAKFPFEINDGNYIRYMGDMEPEQVVAIPYSMRVRDKAKTGFYPITYHITYREESGGDFMDPVDKVFYVRIKGEDDDELAADAGDNERTKSRIIVDSFTTDPAEVYAGQPFLLKVKMKNASSNVQASNIMFTFESETVSDSPVFTTDTGSTSMVVNSLSPGATTDLQLLFRSSPTAEQKSYTMTIKEKYDSPEFKNAEESVKISIQVKQKPRLNTGTIEVMPDTINVGSETNVMFGVNNTGKVLLYNVMARFEGNSIQTSDAYVGNIKPGETGNVDTMITGIAPTEDDGKIKIIISFEDENGGVTEVEKEMTLMVMKEMPDEFENMEAGNMGAGSMDGMGGMEGEGEEKSFLVKYQIPLIAGALALVIASAFFVRWKKKKKKEKEEEGMDDEIS